MPTGSLSLRHHASAAADALDHVVEALWSVSASRGFIDIVTAASRITAAIHGTEPLLPSTPVGPHGWTDTTPAEWRQHNGLTDAERSILTFAEQCSIDVSAMTPSIRADFLAEAGPVAGDLAAALWVVDVVPRTRAGLDALFGVGPWPDPTGSVEGQAGADLWGALDEVIRVVPSLDVLDPITSELVRLRVARQHDCRLCKSLRSRSALRAGADDAAFAAVDDYQASTLTPLAQAALSFTDALVWTPGRIDPSVVTTLQAEATPAQQIEIVLDVTRNALNKIAVGLGADAAHVDEGIEIYDVEPDGTLVYGLEPD